MLLVAFSSSGFLLLSFCHLFFCTLTFEDVNVFHKYMIAFISSRLLVEMGDNSEKEIKF